MTTFKQDVSKGMRLLDRVGPDGWRDMIDCETLDLADCTRCILGQVYGGYTVGLHALEASSVGFSAGHGFSSFGGYTYSALTAAWRKALDCDDVP